MSIEPLGTSAGLFTSESCKRCVFSQEGHIFCPKVLFRMYLSRALEVNNRSLFDSLGFMVVDKIKKPLLRIAQ